MFNRTNQSLFSRWWWTLDHRLFAAICVLITVGLLLVMAASPAVAERINLPSFHFVIRQVAFIVIGFVLMIATSLCPIPIIRRLAVIGFFGALFLMVLVLAVGTEVKGAQRWLHVPGFSLQPSELLKPCFAIFTAWILTRGVAEPRFPGFIIAICAYLIVIGLLILQPDIGMSLAVTAVFGVQLFLASLPMVFVIGGIILLIGSLGAAYILFPHVANRINGFLSPELHDNYQVARSLEAFINGGVLGTGPGEGLIKHRVPDAHTDFIFAVAGEELGLFACLLIVGLYLFIFYRASRSVTHTEDVFKLLSLSGLLMVIVVQTLVNMGVALNLLPNTGMTLPFISYGGSATLGTALGFGMILGLTRRDYYQTQQHTTRIKLG